MQTLNASTKGLSFVAHSPSSSTPVYVEPLTPRSTSHTTSLTVNITLPPSVPTTPDGHSVATVFPPDPHVKETTSTYLTIQKKGCASGQLKGQSECDTTNKIKHGPQKETKHWYYVSEDNSDDKSHIDQGVGVLEMEIDDNGLHRSKQ